MIKKLLIVVALCLMMVAPVWAADLTFEWDQELSQGFTGWKLYMAVDSPGGPYLSPEVANIAYDGSGATHYTSEQAVETLPGTHTYYFVLVAFAAGYDPSANSNEVSVELTSVVPAPLHFSVTISTD